MALTTTSLHESRAGRDRPDRFGPLPTHIPEPAPEPGAVNTTPAPTQPKPKSRKAKGG